jgi:hypothetical protein
MSRAVLSDTTFQLNRLSSYTGAGTKEVQAAAPITAKGYELVGLRYD